MSSFVREVEQDSEQARTVCAALSALQEHSTVEQAAAAFVDAGLERSAELLGCRPA